jgi:hypothetical protein
MMQTVDPHCIVFKKHGNIISANKSILPFWSKLGLEPLSGSL